MNGLTLHEWWLRSGIFVLIAVWRIHQSIRRRPSTASVLITIAFIAIAANLVFEALAHVESQQVDGRPYTIVTVQALALMIAWCAACAYYAHADNSTLAKRILIVVFSLAAATFVLLVATGRAVPPGVRLKDYTQPEVVRFFVLEMLFSTAALATGGFLAARVARRSRGSLRAAMALASLGQGMLAAVLPLLFVEVWGQYRDIRVPSVRPLCIALYLPGGVLWLLSFGAVAAAHRTKQLTAMRRAIRDNRTLRNLLHDLEAISPAKLSYPRTGWTPLLLQPHSALLRTRIECRDRLLTLSPQLGTELTPHDRQQPDAIARALVRLRARGLAHTPAEPAHPIAILTADGSPHKDWLTELAHSYTRLTRP
ncbi:hypothetical protein [Nocardia nepalensis]|uniref:hypothetical protein n=1 Tax=Nocardia nepalensis TaxID=3375448 RepID=UPI003B66B131